VACILLLPLSLLWLRPLLPCLPPLPPPPLWPAVTNPPNLKTLTSTLKVPLPLSTLICHLAWQQHHCPHPYLRQRYCLLLCPLPPSLTPESDSLTREESDRGKGGGHRAEEFMFSFPLLINPTTLCKDFLSNKQHVTKTLRELNYAPEIFSALELGCGRVVTPPREVAAGGGSTPASSTRPRSGLQ
jgi:hypothetical protein